MSPQTKLTIKELDGLPAGEIDLRITQAEQRTVKAMEEKLDEHREVIESRLDAQDDRLECVQSTLATLAGSNGLPGLVQSLKNTVEAGIAKQEASVAKQEAKQEASVARQNDWHEGDLSYRVQVKSRLGSLEDQVKRINWFVSGSNICARGLARCMDALKTEAFWKVFGVAFLIWLISHFAPGAAHILKETFLQ